MNVASKGLCKDLHELSGWTRTHTVWHYDTIVSPFACGYEDINAAIHFTPAYDLGYLLRKLPGTTQTFKMPSGKYRCWLNISSTTTTFEHDTPEDAAAKLAIELFKQGILEREA